MSRADRRPYTELVTQDWRVHRSVYTDPHIFEDEMSRIFGGTWVYLLHESEIPASDDFRTLRVGRRPVIVSRTAEGAVLALLNRCTHRGTLLCPLTSGSAARFQCAYHGWTFANTGRLIGVTYPDGYRPDLDRASLDLSRLPRVESYRGYVFGSLNPDVEPVADWLGAARPVFDWAVDSLPDIRMLRASTMEYHGNWKLQNDNNGDMYHTSFTHKSTAVMTERRHGRGRLLDHFTSDEGPMVVRSFGNGHKMIDQRPSISSPWQRTRPIPGKERYAEQLGDRIGHEAARQQLEYIGQSGINLILYPNLHIRGNGSLSVYEPITVDRTLVHTYVALLVDGPPEVNALRMRFAEDFVNVGNRDDNEIFERTQDALTNVCEVEWVDVSRGWATDRESLEPSGARVGNIADETGIRSAYHQWQKLMDADPSLSSSAASSRADELPAVASE
jgi:phenylpropionate dioxygenase-like ring-hydroxylating dioxygenase large terminal subunit